MQAPEAPGLSTLQLTMQRPTRRGPSQGPRNEGIDESNVRQAPCTRTKSRKAQETEDAAYMTADTPKAAAFFTAFAAFQAAFQSAQDHRRHRDAYPPAEELEGPPEAPSEG